MYRTYNTILAGLIALVVASLLGLGFWLQPVKGDLTRLGGHSERYHRWNGPQAAFSPPLAQPAPAGGHHDILVFGDSFSMRAPEDPPVRDGGYWTDYLAAETGLSVGVFHA